MGKLKMKYEFLTPSTCPNLPRDQINTSSVWGGMKETTTAHGIPHVTNARGDIKRGFWGLMTAVCVGTLLYHFWTVSSFFSSFHVNVNVVIEHQRPTNFPAVTVCNMNPVKRSVLAKDPKLKALLGQSNRKKRDLAERREKRATRDCSCNVFFRTCFFHPTRDGRYSYTDAENFCASRQARLVVIPTIWHQAELRYRCKTRKKVGNYDGLWFKNGTSERKWVKEKEHPKGYWASKNFRYDCIILSDTGWMTKNCTEEPQSVQCEKTDLVYTSSLTAATTVFYSTTRVSTSGAFISTTMESGTSTTPSGTSKMPVVASSGVATTATTTAATTTAAAATTTAIPKPTTIVTTPIGSQQTTTLGPQPVQGSKFPERVQTRESFQLEEKVTEILSELPEEIKKDMGFSVEEFILACTYDGELCNKLEFEKFYNNIHGNCYIFNSGWNASKLFYKAHRGGRRHGLSLILNIEQEEYVDTFSDTAGVRVLVHDQSRMPFPEDEGVIVSPGYLTSVKIIKSAMNRLGPPYGDCTDERVSHSSKNVFEEAFPVQYSGMSCHKTCYQRHLIKRCGCADPLIPKYGKAFDNVRVSTCNTNDITQDDCMYEVGELYKNNKLECDCTQACNDINYKYLLSRWIWPSDAFEAQLHRQFDTVIPSVMIDPNDTQKYRRNLLKLVVYFEDFNYEVIKEMPAYAPEKFLSDIGGILGLWVAFSVFTIFEFVEFFMDIFALQFLKLRNRH